MDGIARWCDNAGESRKIEYIPAGELNGLFLEIRKKNGENYEPASLTAFQRSIDRHFKDVGKECSILTDKEFEGSRRALEAKRKSPRPQGKGGKVNAAEPLTEQDEECLWSTGQLGSDNPTVLLHTTWFLGTMHFGWMNTEEFAMVTLKLAYHVSHLTQVNSRNYLLNLLFRQ